MQQVLKDKVIVISGGTKGVGRTMAEECAIRGAKIVIGGRDEEAAKNSIRLIESYGKEAIFVQTELTEVDSCKHLFDVGAERFGRIDGFFNYAGVTHVSPLDTCTPEVFDDIMNINFKAAFFFLPASDQVYAYERRRFDHTYRLGSRLGRTKGQSGLRLFKGCSSHSYGAYITQLRKRAYTLQLFNTGMDAY